MPASSRLGAVGRLAVGLFISLVCTLAALWKIDWGQVLSSLSRVDAGWLALALASVAATTLAKAIRWRQLIPPGCQPALGRVFSVLNVAMLLNSFLPARLGDVARVVLLDEPRGPGKSALAGALLLEKLSDLVALPLLVALLGICASLPPWLLVWLRRMGLIGLAAVLALAAGLGATRAGWLPRLRAPGGVLCSRLGEAAARAWRCVRLASNGPTLLRTSVWTLVILALGAGTNLLVFRALGLDLPLSAALFLLVVLLGGAALPSAPGRLGVFQYFTLLCLAPFGVSQEAGLACGIFLNLVVIAPLVLVGGLALWLERMPWERWLAWRQG